MSYPRDLIGYGRRPPHPRWPGQARLALQIVLNYEEGGERAILHGDAEYSPGLMVGMLFVPFFNLYWIFRAVPGLSLAIQQEMKYVAPHRQNAAGWVPGLAGSIIFLIPFPPVWIIALCMLLAWMLLANNAIQRLIRIHNDLRKDAQHAGGMTAE